MNGLLPREKFIVVVVVGVRYSTIPGEAQEEVKYTVYSGCTKCLVLG